jgi:hypothetical protein
MISFGSFSFVETVDKWITGLVPDASILLAWPCEKIGRAAERFDPVGTIEARPEGSSRRPSAWSTRRPDTILGKARMMQGWFRGHKTIERSIP